MTADATAASRSAPLPRQVEERLTRLLAEAHPATVGVRAHRERQFDLGLAWVHLPVGRGGLGLAPSLQRAIDARLRAAGAPKVDPVRAIGLALTGPTFATHGSDALCARHLRPTFTGEHSWCQLFSEPGAGSDMADLACRAERDGEGWVVTGQKVWTTNAHLATHGLLLARTDPAASKHGGITFFAVDLAAPGVEVRPLRQLTGQAEFSEVFLDEVRIADAERVGDLGEGWRVARSTLANERSSIGGGSSSSRGSGAIAEAVELWRALPEDRRSPATRQRVAKLWIEAEVLRLTGQRAAVARRAGNPGPEGSIAKLAFGSLNQRTYELCVDLLGPAGLVDADYELRREDHVGYVGPPGSSRAMFLRARANTIEGGTTEIQRDIVGERVLGLPREPRPDRDTPWDQLRHA